MNFTFVYYASDSFESRVKILEDSLKKHHSWCKRIRIRPDTNIPVGQYIPGMAKERLQKALETLEGTNARAVIVIGADCELFDRLYEVENLIRDGKDIILVPHVISPVQDRNLMARIYQCGHANADFMVFNNTENAKNALKWMISVTAGHDPGGGIFYEQTWLSSLPFLFPNIHILRHPGYNVGYWDANYRNITFQKSLNLLDPESGYWYANGERIKMVQYSGFIEGQPEKMSKYSTETCSGEVLNLFNRYDARIQNR